MAGIAGTRLEQAQASRNPNTDGGEASDTPPLSKELMLISDCWKKKNRFSLVMQALRGYSCSYTQAFIGSTKWIQ